MQNPNAQQIQDRFDSLPADIKSVMTDPAMVESVKRVGQKYKLRIDKVGALVDHVGSVMLGLAGTDTFVSDLAALIDVPRETAEHLAVDIDEQVFKRVRESLRQIQYGSSASSRFEEIDDSAIGVVPTPADEATGDSVARDSLLRDIETTANPADVASYASTGDYNPADFAADPAIANQAPRATVATPQATAAPVDSYRESVTEAQKDPGFTAQPAVAAAAEPVGSGGGEFKMEDLLPQTPPPASKAQPAMAMPSQPAAAATAAADQPAAGPADFKIDQTVTQAHGSNEFGQAHVVKPTVGPTVPKQVVPDVVPATAIAAQNEGVAGVGGSAPQAPSSIGPDVSMDFKERLAKQDVPAEHAQVHSDPYRESVL